MERNYCRRLGASALAFVLHTFAGAIGVSLSSTAPTWRDASVALVLLSGLYLVLMALASFGFGGYLAARLRAPVDDATGDTEFRDGMHGLIVWALATLLTGLIALATVQAVPRPAAWTIGALLIFIGVGLAGSAIIKFKLTGTTIRPDRGSNSLVVEGPYKITRNPMYLGLALVYLGIGIAEQSIWALVLLPRFANHTAQGY